MKEVEDPVAANLLRGITDRAIAATNLESLEDTVLAGEELKAESNLMKKRFEMAIKTKYQ